jgi:hypothetical protein
MSVTVLKTVERGRRLQTDFITISHAELTQEIRLQNGHKGRLMFPAPIEAATRIISYMRAINHDLFVNYLVLYPSQPEVSGQLGKLDRFIEKERSLHQEIQQVLRRWNRSFTGAWSIGSRV